MPYKLKVKTDGKETIYERKEAPMLENLLDALKVQRQEIVMYSDPKKLPTDKDNERLLSLRAEFAANFWKNGLMNVGRKSRDFSHGMDRPLQAR